MTYEEACQLPDDAVVRYEFKKGKYSAMPVWRLKTRPTMKHFHNFVKWDPQTEELQAPIVMRN